MTATRPVSSYNLRTMLLSVMSLMLAACSGPPQLTSDSVDYAEAYAESSNRQMLINLARREQGHPAYFLQLGAITATYVHVATGSVGVNRTIQTGVAPAVVSTSIPAPGSSFTLGRTEQPTFSFTPLAGKSFATALLNPISSDIFFEMLDQGVHANQLLRTLVQSVTFYWPETGYRRVLVNVADEERFAEFRDFLKLAGLMRALQRRQLLVTGTVKDASGKPVRTLLGTGAPEIRDLISSDPTLNYMPGVEATLLKGAPQVSFNFRTFDGVLAALATEQEVYDLLVKRHGDEFLMQIPSTERDPILRIKWDGSKVATTAPTVAVEYRGTNYAIQDRILSEGQDQVATRRWNRSVFVLLSHLYTTISLDPADLPTQQLIQIK